MLQSYLGATTRQAGFSLIPLYGIAVVNLSQCKLLGWPLPSVQTIGWYTVMSSYQRKQLRCQFSFSKKSSPNAMNKSSSQCNFFCQLFSFQGKQLGCYTIVKLSPCKQPCMVFLFCFSKGKKDGSL
jgi:hypothetical protein